MSQKEEHEARYVVTALGELFESLHGVEVPGGCDLCDAYQRIEAGEPGVWHMTVFHDDDCPFLDRL